MNKVYILLAEYVHEFEVGKESRIQPGFMPKGIVTNIISGPDNNITIEFAGSYVTYHNVCWTEGMQPKTR